jgi:hypothetical protein
LFIYDRPELLDHSIIEVFLLLPQRNEIVELLSLLWGVWKGRSASYKRKQE